MKLVRFTTKEQEKYKVIKDLVDYTRNNRKTAIILGVAIRHVNSLIKVYKQQKSTLNHHNKGRLSVNSVPLKLSNKIVLLHKLRECMLDRKTYFEFDEVKKEIKKKYIPSISYPRKRTSFIAYMNTIW